MMSRTTAHLHDQLDKVESIIMECDVYSLTAKTTNDMLDKILKVVRDRTPPPVKVHCYCGKTNEMRNDNCPFSCGGPECYQF